MQHFTYIIGYPYCNPVRITVKATDAWDALGKVLDELEYERELDLTQITDLELERGAEYENARALSEV